MILRSRWNSSLFSVCFVLLCFVRSIVLNNYNCCWVDAHIVRVAAWVCKCATENKKGDYFHMCAPFDTHSDSIWYLSTCPANTLTHTLTHTNCWWFLSFCLLFYLISFHFFKKRGGGDGGNGKCLMLSLLTWSRDGGTSYDKRKWNGGKK